MKKITRTHLMGIVCLAYAAFLVWQTTLVPERMVVNEPGPKAFPFLAAAGIAVMAILSMIFDAPKEAKNGNKPYLDKAGWIRLVLIMAEVVIFCVAMQVIGFWFAAMLGVFAFIWTLKGDKKANLLFAILFSVALGSICYFGFTRGFHIPLPSGSLWRSLGITLP